MMYIHKCFRRLSINTYIYTLYIMQIYYSTAMIYLVNFKREITCQANAQKHINDSKTKFLSLIMVKKYSECGSIVSKIIHIE